MRDKHVERRQHARTTPKGTIVLRAGDQRQRGRISNISPGGMLAKTSVTMPERMLGRPTEVDLRLDDREARWFKLRGKILRITAQSVAVSFDDTPATFLDRLAQVATEAHTERRRLSVVLVDGLAERRATMAAGFRDNGCSVLETSTVLEVIVRLGEAVFEPNLIAIADSVPTESSENLRRFVEREHPQAKLITIGDLDPGGIVHWLSTEDPAADLSQRVRRLLSQPNRK